jgi:hypothetical protein
MNEQEELQALQAELAKREELESLQAELARRETFGDNDQEYTNEPAHPSTPSSNSESPFTRIGGVFTHGLASGIGGLADFGNMIESQALDPESVAEQRSILQEKLQNPEVQAKPSEMALSHQNISPEFRDYIGGKVNQLFGTDLTPQDAFEKLVHLTGEFSIPVPIPGLGSASKATSLPLKALKHEAIAAGGAAGIVGAEAAGVENELGKMAAGIGGAALTDINPRKALYSLAGFGKKNLKREAIEAGERIHVDLTGPAATKASRVNQTQHYLEKFPFLGEMLDEASHTTKQQYINSFESMMDAVAPRLEVTQTLSDVTESLYRAADHLKPEGVTFDASSMLKTIKEIKENKPALVKEESTKELFRILNEFEEAVKAETPKIFDQYGNPMKGLNLGEAKTKPITLNQLLDQKIELNKMMAKRDLFNKLDSDSRGYLGKLGKTMDDMLEEWGVKNAPEYLKAYRKANQEWGDYAKRADLDYLLANDLSNLATDEPNFTSLLKKINARENQKLLENALGEESYSKLKDYSIVGKAIADVGRRNKNKSGSGHTIAAVALMGEVIRLMMNPSWIETVLALGTAGAATGATKALTSKKFINLAKRFADEPTLSAAQRLEKLVTETAGISVSELNRKMENANSPTVDKG